jgi:ribosomal protein S18 acetylase RimI-like enzyme
MITFSSLQKVDNLTLTSVFNASFSDYLIPMELTVEELAAKLDAESYQARYSVGAFDDDELVGFILHGYRKENDKRNLYNSGTGVIPTYRGKGLTMQMYAHFMAECKENFFDEILLEVLENNHPAMTVYEKSGFVKRRFLKCYKSEIGTTNINQEIEIEPVVDIEWQAAQSFWEVSPSWQNDIQTIQTMGENLVFLQATCRRKLVGYLVYNPNNKRILQLSVAPEFRRKKIASMLFNHLGNEFEREFSITNIDDTCISAISFLEALGAKNFVNQWEMAYRSKAVPKQYTNR